MRPLMAAPLGRIAAVLALLLSTLSGIPRAQAGRLVARLPAAVCPLGQEAQPELQQILVAPRRVRLPAPVSLFALLCAQCVVVPVHPGHGGAMVRAPA